MVKSFNDGPNEGSATEQAVSQDHIALIYDTAEEKLISTVPLIKVGLEKGELCLYISDAEDDQEIIQALEAQHIDVEKAVSTSGLILSNKQEVYFKLGRFDPDWTIQVIKNVAELAVSYGFTAMRIISDMRWTQDSVPGVDRWPEYEVKLCILDLGLRLRTTCLYDRGAFSHQALLYALKTHPKLVCQGTVFDNMFFISPERLEAGEEAAAELESMLAAMKAASSAEMEATSRERKLRELSERLDMESRSRSAAETSLEESRTRLRALTERSSEWVWELGPDGTYTYSSPRVKDLLGLAAEEVLGRRPEDLVDEEDTTRIAAAIARALSDRTSISALEKKHRNRDGHIVHLEMNGAPILDRDGILQGYRGIDRDVTGRKTSKKAIDEHRRKIDELTADLNARDVQLRSLEEEVGHLRGSLGAKENAVSALSAALKEREDAVSALSNALKEKEAERSLLAESLGEKEEKRLALAESLKEKDDAASTLSAALKVKEEELLVLAEALKEKEAEASRMAEEVGTLASEVSSLTEQLQQARDASSLDRMELDRQTAQLELLRYNLASLEANMDVIKADHKDQLQQASEAAALDKEELKRRDAQLELLRYNLAGLEANIEVIVANHREQMLAAEAEARAEHDALNASLSIRVEEVASLREAKAAVESEVGSIRNSLRSTMSEAETFRRERDSFRDAKSAAEEDLKKRAVELSVASDRAQKAAAETNELRGRLDDMEAKLSFKEEELASYRSREDELTRRTDEMSAEAENLRGRLADMESRLSSREEEAVVLRSREDELIKHADEMSAEVEDLRGRLTGLDAELRAREGELADCRSREEGIKASLTSGEMEIGMLKKRMNAAGEEKASLLEEIDSRDKEIASLQVQLAAANAETLAARNEQEVLQNSLAESGRELNERRGQLRALLRQSKVGVARIDLDGKLLEANAAFHSLLGREPGSLAGAHYRDHTHRDDLASSAEVYRRLRESGGSASIVKRYVRKHGGVATVALTLSSADGPDGAPSYYMALAFDRTEEVPETIAAVEAPAASIGGTDLARRLNDALTVISGSVTLAKEYVIPEGRMYGQLAQIERASREAARLTAELEGAPSTTPSEQPAVSAPAKPIPGRGRVLLVDSDEAVLETTTHMLRHLGYDVDVARDGEEASAVCRHASEGDRAFALAIIDAGTPSGDEGRTIASRLMSENPGLRAMVSSGQVTHPALADPGHWGFEGALPRPYSLEGLSRAVGAALQGKT